MAETVIELDLSVPWEPPEPPAPRRRLQSRWVAVAAVLAVTLGVLVAGGPRPDAGQLYTIDFQVLRAQASGGRIFLSRYQQTGPGPMIEARRSSDGKLLWERSAEITQQLFTAGPDVAMLMNEDGTGRSDASAFIALDAATGKELWSRSRIRFSGVAPGVVIVEDVRDEPVDAFIDGTDLDSGINHAGPQPQRRFLGLSARTGATVWDVTVPEGSAAAFSWDNPYQSRLRHIDVLSRTGQLTRLDTRTGAVTATHQLDWSGSSAMFSAGWPDGSGRTTDRVVLYPDGERGAVVYDLATGRLLFRWAGGVNNGLFRCTDRLFCTNDGTGLTAVDNTTGERRWHVAGQDLVLGFAGTRLLIGTYRDMTGPQPVLTGILDSRTGAVAEALDGWRVLGDGGRPLVWRAVDKRTAVLGELDPATGTVATFARAEDWFGNPECTIDGKILACVVVGGLSVWRLPNRH